MKGKRTSKGGFPGLVVLLAIVLGGTLGYAFFEISRNLQEDLTLHEAKIVDNKASLDIHKRPLQSGLRFALEETALESGKTGMGKERWKEPDGAASPVSKDEAESLLLGGAQSKYGTYVNAEGYWDRDANEGKYTKQWSGTISIADWGDKTWDAFTSKTTVHMEREIKTQYIEQTLKTDFVPSHTSGIRYYYTRRIGEELAKGIDSLLTYHAWACVNKLKDEDQRCGPCVPNPGDACDNNIPNFNKGTVDSCFSARVNGVEGQLNDYFKDAKIEWALDLTSETSGTTTMYEQRSIRNSNQQRCSQSCCKTVNGVCVARHNCWHQDASHNYKYMVDVAAKDVSEDREVVTSSGIENFYLKFKAGSNIGTDNSCGNSADEGGGHDCPDSQKPGQGKVSNPFPQTNVNVIVK